jgi:hypothetical protein
MLQVLHRFPILFHYLLSLLLVFLQNQEVAQQSKATTIIHSTAEKRIILEARCPQLESPMGFVRGKKMRRCLL